MPIDWFTVGAQVFNFLLLVVLLRIFLYRPILDAMDKREEEIASRLEDAEKRRDEADEERRKLESRRQEFEEKKDDLFAEARKNADEREKQLIEEAREKAEEAKQKWLDHVERDRDSFLENVRRRIGEETCSLARKALADMADADLEKQMVRVFLGRLRDLDGKDRESIEAMKSGDGLVVRSAFDLSEKLREEIRETWKKTFDSDMGMRFETSGDLLCGIELRVRDRKVGWSLDDYLDTLDERLAEAIDEK